MLREVIVQSGASSRSEQVPRAHSISGIATSSAFFHNWSLRSVLEAAAWRSNTVFPSFYLQDFSFTSDGVHSLGPFVAAVNALGNSHLFLTCSGGGGVILVCFPQQLA